MATKKSAPAPSKTAASKSAIRSSKKAVPSGDRSDYAVRFFVADDIRTDSDGKSMLIGFYPDNVVVLKLPPDVNPTKAKPIAISALTFMFTISAPEGIHRAVVSLQRGANGKPKNVADAQFEIAPQKSSFNIIAKATPFVVYGLGVQPLEVEVDGHRFEGTIEIRRFGSD